MEDFIKKIDKPTLDTPVKGYYVPAGLRKNMINREYLAGELWAAHSTVFKANPWPSWEEMVNSDDPLRKRIVNGFLAAADRAMQLMGVDESDE